MWAITSLVYGRRPRNQRDSINNEIRSISMQITDATRGTTSSASNSEEVSVPLLFSLARTWAWQAVEFRCQSHPHEARADVVDASGDTVLHWCVFGRPPFSVVRTLLDTCPELARVQNKRGCLPLHVACSYRASADIIRALLEVYPEGAAVRSSNGSFPLHLSCDFGGSLSTLRAILETEAGAKTVLWTDRTFQRTPLNIMHRRRNVRYFHTMIERMRIMRENQRKLEKEDPEGNKDEIANIGSKVSSLNDDDYWKEASLLSLVGFLGRALRPGDEDEQQLIRACIANRECPSSVREFALLLCVDRLLEPDDNGELLLHWLIQRASASVILEICYLNPDAMKVRDRSGRLPFELSLGNSDLTWKNGFSQLLQAHPAAIDDLNLDFRLIPVVLSKFSDKNALCKLLRTKPNILQHCR